MHVTGGLALRVTEGLALHLGLALFPWSGGLALHLGLALHSRMSEGEGGGMRLGVGMSEGEGGAHKRGGGAHRQRDAHTPTEA